MAKEPGFFTRLLTRAAVKAATGNVPFIASLATSYLTMSSAVFRQDFLQQYKNFVFACVQARAEEVGNIEFELFNGDEEVDQHEVLDLLNKPNPYMTRHDFLMAHQAFLDLDGNSFWFLSRANNGKGAITEIYLLRPDRVAIVPSKTNPLTSRTSTRWGITRSRIAAWVSLKRRFSQSKPTTRRANGIISFSRTPLGRTAS